MFSISFMYVCSISEVLRLLNLFETKQDYNKRRTIPLIYLLLIHIET